MRSHKTIYRGTWALAMAAAMTLTSCDDLFEPALENQRDINAMEGEKVNGYHDGRDGLGHMMAQGKTLAEAREKIRRTEEKMEIEVES